MVDILEIITAIDSRFLMVAIVLLLTVEVFLLSFPKEVVMIYSGFAFGLVIGSVINLFGLFGAIWLGYEGGRLGKFGLERLRGHRLVSRYEEKISQEGLIGLSLLRLFPLTPNDILSIICGFLNLRRTPYLIVSFLTAIPYAILWAYVGSRGLTLVQELFPSTYDPITWVFSFGLVVLVLWYLGRKVFREEMSAQNAMSDS